QLGKNVAFLAPAVNPSKIPPSMEKEFDVAFVGPVIDPSIYENAWKERLDEGLYMFATELGRLIYRNPDMPLRYASSFMISQFNPQFQESLMKFQQERDEDFMALLAEIGGYAMNLRRWHILDSIDDIEINVLGEVRGETKDNVIVYEDINKLNDITTFLSRSKISLLSQPPFLPSSLGLTTFYSVAANTLTMVEEKLSAKSFFVEEQEIITYHPMDSVEIEGKLIYYLEDAPNEREEIAKNGKDRVFKDHTLYQRGEILGNILEDIIQQASQQSQNKEN
ncbi:MAG: glycosyltransferase family 1 protein, partial [Aquificota bacterium]